MKTAAWRFREVPKLSLLAPGRGTLSCSTASSARDIPSFKNTVFRQNSDLFEFLISKAH